MACNDNSRCHKDQKDEETADEVTDVVSLALGSMCHSFDIDVLSPLCNLDISCDRRGDDLAAEKVVIGQVVPPNMQPLDVVFLQGGDDLEHTRSADGTAPSTVHSAEASMRELQDRMMDVVEVEQKHQFGTAACNLQKRNVNTSGMQETEVPLDLSQHRVEVSLGTKLGNISRKALKCRSDDETHMGGPLVIARSTATSPLNVTSHMKDDLVITETRVPHDLSHHTTDASNRSKSVTVSGDHTYGATRRGSASTDNQMAGPLASARSTVTSPVSVTSHMKDVLVTTDSSNSKMSRVTSSRQSATSESEEHNCHSCSEDEGPLDLSPRGQVRKGCGHGSVTETPDCTQPHTATQSTDCALDKASADVALGSSDITSQHDKFESVDLQENSPLMTASENATHTAAETIHEVTVSTTCEETLQLDMLPPEIIFHVCVFLDARFIVTTLSCVCKTLHSLLGTRAFWKGRMYQRWQNKFPAVPVAEDSYDWRKVCIGCEDFQSRWSEPENSLAHLKLTRAVYASVDAVHLMQNARLLVAGSRDRYLNVFDLSTIDLDRPETVNNSLVFSKMNAHQGWIWSMSSLDNLLATGSWDMMVKFWDLDVGQCVQFVRCQSALLCSHLEPGFYVAGAFNWRLYHIDPRLSTIVAVKKYHTHPVLCLAADDHYIISGSEDRTVCVYDRRADRLLKTLTLDSYPMCMSYSDSQLWLGDKSGQVNLVDASQGRFNFVKTYDVGHHGKLTGIEHTAGGIFTCCTDKTIKVLEPTSQPQTICTIVSDDCAIARIDYNNEILASANSDMSIGIWLPRRHLTS